MSPDQQQSDDAWVAQRQRLEADGDRADQFDPAGAALGAMTSAFLDRVDGRWWSALRGHVLVSLRMAAWPVVNRS